MGSEIINRKGFQRAQRTSKPLGLQKRLFTLAEASIYLGRSVYSVRTLVWAGKLPIVKNGKKQWIDLFDLERFIEENKVSVV